MTTQDLVDQIELTPLSRIDPRPVTGVFISDMLSDVMAGAKSGDLWLTVQTHKNIIPAANLVDAAAVVITSGKNVPQETIDLANKYNIAILSSPLSVYELVGRLYSLGIGVT